MEGVMLWASHLMTCSPKYSTIKPFLTKQSSSQNDSSVNLQPSRKFVLSRCGSCKRLISTEEPPIGGEHEEMITEESSMWCDGKCMDEAHVLLEEVSMEELAEAFAVFDENGDGFIGAEELQIVMRQLLGRGMGMEECSSMIKAYDEDGDGRISFNEFKNMMECC